MAYPNYYNSYQPNYYQPQTQMSPLNQPAQQQPIIWVQGIDAARAYMVAPNNTVQLWDSESQTIYIKSADVSGMPSMRILDWTERAVGAPTPQQGDYITRKEFDALAATVAALKGENE